MWLNPWTENHVNGALDATEQMWTHKGKLSIAPSEESLMTTDV